MWQFGGLQDRRCHVDDVVKLVAYLALRLDPAWPVDDETVAGAAEVRCDLLRPLIRRVHGMRPADRVVILRACRAQLVNALDQELGRSEVRSLGGSLVVPG